MDFSLLDYQVLEVKDSLPINSNVMNDNIDYGVRIIGAKSEWEETKGKGIKVAILDTGVDYNHPDLVDRIKGGINFTTNDPNDYMDRKGHGTHCAGIICSSLNNQGFVGVAPEVDLYVVKTLGDDGTGSADWIIRGIKWCIENGIHVISMSTGSKNDHSGIKKVIDEAVNSNIIIVAAAGNLGEGEDTINYPAKYSNVISVGAIDSEENRGNFSSTGSHIDVMAPGVDIMSTYTEGRYARLSGTSMACPHIAGAVALIQSKAKIRYNRFLGFQEVLLLLQMNSKDLGEKGKDNKYGYGFFSFE